MRNFIPVALMAWALPAMARYEDLQVDLGAEPVTGAFGSFAGLQVVLCLVALASLWPVVLGKRSTWRERARGAVVLLALCAGFVWAPFYTLGAVALALVWHLVRRA